MPLALPLELYHATKITHLGYALPANACYRVHKRSAGVCEKGVVLKSKMPGLLAFGVTILLLALLAASASAVGEPITISPASGPPGSTVTVNGSGWQGSSDVPIQIDGKTLAMAHPDANGNFSVQITIPKDAAPGSRLRIDALYGNGGSANAWFDVTGSGTGTGGGGGHPPGGGEQGQAGKRQIDYFALGDSVASGHGLPGAKGKCKRSPEAYPWVVTSLLKERYDSVNTHVLACSGATSDKLQGQVDNVVNNLSADRPALVSITIGANDFEFSNKSKTAQRLCSTTNDQDYLTWVNKTAAKVKVQVKDDVKRLLSSDPNVVVAITDYYNPMNKKSTYYNGLVKSAPCSQARSRFEYARNRLNGAYLDAWDELGRPTRVRFAVVNAVFDGHESPRPSCGRADPQKDKSWIQSSDCFHPNVKGATQIGKTVSKAAHKAAR